jgi:hypothetical protein
VQESCKPPSIKKKLTEPLAAKKSPDIGAFFAASGSGVGARRGAQPRSGKH